jgi:hypothetical protein
LTSIRSGTSADDLIGAQWHKSLASSPQGNCVELARLPGERVALRNSRHPDGPALIFTKGQIKALIDALKNGAFDHLVHGPPETRR